MTSINRNVSGANQTDSSLTIYINFFAFFKLSLDLD